MPLKLKLDANNAAVLSDGKPVYIDDDGKEIAYDANQTVATITRLNGESKGHRERAEQAEAKVKTFEGITDPAAAIAALKTVSNLDAKKLVDAGEVEKVKAEAIKAVEEKYQPIVKQRDTLQGQLNSHVIGHVFASSKFIAEKFAAQGPAGIDLGKALFAAGFKVEDGKAVGYDAQGKQLYSRARPGELANPDEALELMVDAYPHKASILKGEVKQGGGSNGGGGGGGGKTATRAQFDAMSHGERMTFSKDGGQVTE